MPTEYLANISKVIATMLMSAASLFGAQPQIIFIQAPFPPVENVVYQTTTPAPILGTTIAAAADFSSSLAASISSSATEMTLVSTSTKSGEKLMMGRVYGFKIGGREYVLGTIAAGRKVTAMTRGVSLLNGTSTGGVAESWGLGTPVEMTTAPIVVDLANKAAGTSNFDQPLKYDSSVATSTIAADARNLVNYDLLSYTAFNGAGVIDATTAARGVSILASKLQAASSTATSGGHPLVIPASSATSTYNSSGSLQVVVTGNDNKIDSNFLGTIPIASSTTFTSGIPLLKIGKNIFIATTTQIFSRPSGVNYVDVQCVGGGGGGGSTQSGAAMSPGGGGGAGAYIRSLVDLTNSSTVTITIGAGGAAATNGGNTSFGSFLTANGGSAGGVSTGGVIAATNGSPGGAASTTASTTIISIGGGDGTAGIAMSPTSNLYGKGGDGGASFFGGGARGPTISGATAVVGNAATFNAWGSGGSGAVSTNTSVNAGGQGAYGACIVTW